MKYKVTLQGKTYEVEVEKGEAMLVDEYEALSPAPAPAEPKPAPAAAEEVKAAPSPALNAVGTAVKAPLPGNILSVKVNLGDEVKEGELLLVIEAMKMENDVVAPCDGQVKQIAVSAGKAVNTGDTLIVI